MTKRVWSFPYHRSHVDILLHHLHFCICFEGVGLRWNFSKLIKQILYLLFFLKWEVLEASLHPRYNNCVTFLTSALSSCKYKHLQIPISCWPIRILVKMVLMIFFFIYYSMMSHFLVNFAYTESVGHILCFLCHTIFSSMCLANTSISLWSLLKSFYTRLPLNVSLKCVFLSSY